MKRLLIVFAMIAIVGAACGDSNEGETGTTGGQSTDAATTDDGGSDGGDGGGSGGGDDSTDGQDDNENGGSDDDDFGEIVGDPDLDVEDLPGQAGDLADEVDDIVSLGDCVAVGLMATAPEGWMCRVLDNPLPGFDGFTMFTEGNDLNITVGSPSPLGAPCEALLACDEVAPISLSDNFPDTMLLEFAGTILIYGTHATGAELVITKSTALTPEETQLVMGVLDSVEPA